MASERYDRRRHHDRSRNARGLQERRGGRRPARVIKGDSTGKRVIEQSRVRLMCVAAFFALSFGAVGVRVVEVAAMGKPQAQVAALAPVAADAEEGDNGQKVKMPEVSLLRGDIVDRNGALVATSLATASLFANPKVMSNPDKALAKLARKLPGVNTAALREKLRAKKNNFVWIKRNLTPREQQEVNSLGIPGLYFQPEERRVYPQGRMLSHVLGYVGVDNAGLAGVEKYFDKRLRDAERNKEPVQLSLDVRLQNIVYEEIKKGMEDYRAIGATGIVMDIRSGEILAMANLPDFDPHFPTKGPDVARFNRATLGTYEMGSTFKTFTVASALDYGTATMQSGYDASHPLKVARYTISDSHPMGRWLSVPEIYAYSSNIGTVKMAMDVGAERQQKFLRKLGLMQPISVELPEVSPPQYPTVWKDISMMTISYGHGMAVTPLHLVRAIASIAGNGTLLPVTLLKDGNKNKPEGARVVKEETAQAVRRLMRLVVEHGTGGKANVPGYRVGGKTGTAEKVGQAGGYNKSAKMALFVSTFPVDNPHYVVLVIMDEPQPTKATFGFATGGWNAAPVAGRIIGRMAPLYGMKPVYDAPADDADKYWVNKDEKPSIPAAPQGNIHDIAYRPH